MALIDGLIVWYTLDEASGSGIDAHGSVDLTEMGGTVGATSGKINGARDFESVDTEDLRTTSPTGLLVGDNDLTCQVWINPESLTNDRPLDAYSGEMQAYEIFMTAAGAVSFRVNDAAGTVTSSVTLIPGNWYHIIGWHDSVANEIGIFVNGTENTASYSGGMPGVSGVGDVFRLGGWDEFYDGLIDEAAVWSVVKTAAERSLLHNGGAGLTYEQLTEPVEFHQIKNICGRGGPWTVFGALGDRLGGKKALYYDGITDRATFDQSVIASYPFTVIVEFKTASTAAQDRCLFSQSNFEDDAQKLGLRLNASHQVEAFVGANEIAFARAVNDGQRHVAAMTANAAGTVTVYLDREVGGTVAGGTFPVLQRSTLAAVRGTGITEYYDGTIGRVLAYERVLNETEIAAHDRTLSEPRTFNREIMLQYLFVAQHYSLTSDFGSLGLSGQDAVFIHGYHLDSLDGLYLLGGQANLFTVNHIAAADSGAFALMQDAGFAYVRTLVGQYGFFSAGGQNAFFVTTGFIAADHGAFELTGDPAGLFADRFLSHDAGSFAATGQDAGFLTGYVAIAGVGLFSQDGQAAAFVRPYVVTSLHRTFQLTGQDADMRAGQFVSVDHGSFALTGQTVDFRKNYSVVGGDGAYALTGHAAGLFRGQYLAGDFGNFNANGQAAGLYVGFVVDAVRGLFALTGSSMTPFAARLMPADDAGFSLAGQDTSLAAGNSIAADSGGFQETGQAAALVRDRFVAADHGTRQLNGQAVDLKLVRVVVGLHETYAQNGQAAGFMHNRVIAASEGHFALTGQQITLGVVSHISRHQFEFLILEGLEIGKPRE